jgi:hypothetical protein
MILAPQFQSPGAYYRVQCATDLVAGVTSS